MQEGLKVRVEKLDKAVEDVHGIVHRCCRVEELGATRAVKDHGARAVDGVRRRVCKVAAHRTHAERGTPRVAHSDGAVHAHARLEDRGEEAALNVPQGADDDEKVDAAGPKGDVVADDHESPARHDRRVWPETLDGEMDPVVSGVEQRTCRVAVVGAESVDKAGLVAAVHGVEAERSKWQIHVLRAHGRVWRVQYELEDLPRVCGGYARVARADLVLLVHDPGHPDTLTALIHELSTMRDYHLDDTKLILAATGPGGEEASRVFTHDHRVPRYVSSASSLRDLVLASLPRKAPRTGTIMIGVTPAASGRCHC